MAATRDFGKIRLILIITELLFSLVVFITACVWVNALSTSNINFCIFVGITSFLLTLFFLFIQLKKPNDRGLLLIMFALYALYWVFWLSAAAASASTVSWVNAWYSYPTDCSNAGIYGYYFGAYCTAAGRKGAVRACCAFAWLTWACWTASIVLQVIEDVMGPKKIFHSPGKAPAGAATSDAPAAPVADANEKV